MRCSVTWTSNMKKKKITPIFAGASWPFSFSSSLACRCFDCRIYIMKSSGKNFWLTKRVLKGTRSWRLPSDGVVPVIYGKAPAAAAGPGAPAEGEP